MFPTEEIPARRFAAGDDDHDEIEERSYFEGCATFLR
jgi:hypothetical protein